MSQESTMICIDNSEWMRNGDLPPTRFNCQQEAIRALIHYKLRSNPENAVGLLSLANRIDVLNSLLTDDRKLMISLHSLAINGSTNIIPGVKTAYLALKHRKNRNHRQRIIVFVGSPLDELDEQKDAFLKFAKKLKKEKVNADFVLFGEATSEKNQIIADFVNILNGAEGTSSHLLVVPAGDVKLYDALLHSPICEGASAAVGPGGEFGINDEDDPELAMALRISLEEQRLRQQQQQGEVHADDQQPQPVADQGPDASMEVDRTDQGIAIAAEIRPPTPSAIGQVKEQPPRSFDEMTEEEQMEYAIRLSMAAQDDQEPSRSRSPSMAMSTPAPTPMETDEGGISTSATASAHLGDTIGELLNDPKRLKELVDKQGTGVSGGAVPNTQGIRKATETASSTSEPGGQKSTKEKQQTPANKNDDDKDSKK